MNSSSPLYEFAFRGFLAEEGLDKAGRIHRNLVGALDEEYAQRLGIELLDEQLVASARQMAMVYMAITAFENSIRKFISTVLLEKVGEDWWASAVSSNIKKKVESRQKDEEKVRWHTQRGAEPITYTDMGDLGNIMRNSWQHFEAYIPSIEWANSLLDIVERSRNLIMHSGYLGREDVERVGINIRDWIKQVGT
jgi:Swt1-like HEPN